MMLYRQFATQEEIDKEYDVEKSAPDFQRYAEFNISARGSGRPPTKAASAGLRPLGR
jgi:arylformamidase